MRTYQSIKNTLANLSGIIATLVLIASPTFAKPPKGQEGPKQPLPPNIQAAVTTQPATHGANPGAPQATVQLKPGEVPKVEFDTLVYDFGRTKTGKDVEHDFWFHNIGTGPLEIIQVKPSCGCTTSGQYDKVVQSGQSGKIPIKIALGHATGQISKTITVVTNAPGTDSTLTLQVRGELWQVIQATPNSALFGNISAAQTKEGPVTRKLTIVNNGDAPLTMGELNCNNQSFKTELKNLEPGKKWELTVTLGSPLPTGVQSGMIDINTGLSDMPKLQIACSAYLVADVDVVPNKMMIPATRTVNMQRDFYIRNNSSKPIKVTDVVATNPKMKVGLQETQTGMAFRITMDIPPEYTIPKDGDKITFKTDHPNYPTITIPITEAVSGPTPLAAGSRPVPPPAAAQLKPGATVTPNPKPVQGTPVNNPSGH